MQGQPPSAVQSSEDRQYSCGRRAGASPWPGLRGGSAALHRRV